MIWICILKLSSWMTSAPVQTAIYILVIEYIYIYWVAWSSFNSQSRLKVDMFDFYFAHFFCLNQIIPKTFLRNGHMMTHSSKKPYECKYLNCDKSYCDQRSLRRHLENHHQHCTDATPPTSGRMSANSGDSVFQFDGIFMSNFSGRGLESTSSAGVNLSPAPQKAAWPLGYNPLE